MNYGIICLLALMPSLIQNSTSNHTNVLDENYILNHEKVVFEGFETRYLSTDDQLVDVVEEETGEIIIQLKLDYDYTVSSPVGISENASSETVDNFLKTRRNNGKLYHSQRNLNFVNSNNLFNFENLYYSKYAPFVEFTISASELTANNFSFLSQFIEDTLVDKIYVESSTALAKDQQMYSEMVSLDVYEYVRDETFTGEGINVGVLEPSIIDEDHINFTNTTTIVRREWYYIETEGEHTTQVASIIAGTGGIAPKATILSVELSGTPNSEIDWLLDHDVHLVNMSYGDNNPNGKYASDSAYMDYICYKYLVTFIGSAGNAGLNGNIGNPGLGYNVITVGACYSSTNDNSVCGFSSAQVVSGPVKPTIVAPGYNVGINNFYTDNQGSSYSTAFVSGCVALMMEFRSQLKAFPQKVMALIAAGAIDTLGGNYTNGLDSYGGAGEFNFNNIVENYSNSLLLANSETGSYTWTTPHVSIPAGKTIRICMAWLAYSTGSTSSLKVTNYSLKLKDTSGEILATSDYAKNNLEFIEYTSTRTYNSQAVFYIQTTGSKVISTDEKICIAYRVY